MGNTTTSQHGGFPVFALFDDRKTHPAFLKADPTTSSTKLVKVFFCLFLFVLSSADFGRQWGEDNLKLQMFIWFWEKKTLQAPFANCLYLCFEETLDWNQFFIFSFTVSKAHVKTLSAWGRTRICGEGAGRKSDLDQGSETRYFSLRIFHEMFWHKTVRNSPFFEIHVLLGNKIKNTWCWGTCWHLDYVCWIWQLLFAIRF